MEQKAIKYSGKGYGLPPKIMSYNDRRIMNRELEVKVADIARIVAIENGTTFEDICRGTRMGAVLIIRQIAHKIAREVTQAPLAVIASVIGGLDHCSAIHSIKVINNYFDTNNRVVIDVYNKSKRAVESMRTHFGVDPMLIHSIEHMGQL